MTRAALKILADHEREARRRESDQDRAARQADHATTWETRACRHEYGWLDTRRGFCEALRRFLPSQGYELVKAYSVYQLDGRSPSEWPPGRREAFLGELERGEHPLLHRPGEAPRPSLEAWLAGDAGRRAA